MRDSRLISKTYDKEKNIGPDIDIKVKEIPQIKKDLKILKSDEGFEHSIYDDSTGEIIKDKKAVIENDGRIVYSNGTRGGFATIGYGHKITPDDDYEIGVMYKEPDLENQLIKDYISKRSIIRNSIINSGKNPDDIPESVKSILIRNSFWGVSKSSFPMYFDSMLNQEYKNAADNLKFTDPNKGDSGGYTNIYSNEYLRPRTERVMEEIANLFNN
tara:strand:+ start:76 stop:720 length:645 start_codon:yes stop_codon:yes gene_type:complete